jgi:hypothetical protein
MFHIKYYLLRVKLIHVKLEKWSQLDTNIVRTLHRKFPKIILNKITFF